MVVEYWPKAQRSRHDIILTEESFKDKMVAANVEFYRAQCYLAGSIQIACITLTSQIYIGDLVEYRLYFTIATSRYVPVIFNLVCITQFAQSSWYFVALTLCCFSLSTATLSFSQRFWENVITSKYGVHNSFAKSVIGTKLETVSGMYGDNSPTTLLEAWCGAPTQISSGP